MTEKTHAIVANRFLAPNRGRANHKKRTRLTMPQTAQVRRPSAQRLREKRAHSAPIETSLRPPLKWAGGKRWQVPHLRPLWEAHRDKRLVEPFCGGLAVAWRVLA